MSVEGEDASFWSLTSGLETFSPQRQLNLVDQRLHHTVYTVNAAHLAKPKHKTGKTDRLFLRGTGKSSEQQLRQPLLARVCSTETMSKNVVGGGSKYLISGERLDLNIPEETRGR